MLRARARRCVGAWVRLRGCVCLCDSSLCKRDYLFSMASTARSPQVRGVSESLTSLLKTGLINGQRALLPGDAALSPAALGVMEQARTAVVLSAHLVADKVRKTIFLEGGGRRRGKGKGGRRRRNGGQFALSLSLSRALLAVVDRALAWSAREVGGRLRLRVC